MGRKVVSFDPDADLELILTAEEPPELVEQIFEFTEKDLVPTIKSNTANQTAAHTDNAVSQVSAGSDSTETEPHSSNTDIPTPAPSKKEIRFLVSSKHMILASPVFKAMLQYDNFKEGVALSKGTAEVPLPDDDPASWEIILDVIHNNTRRKIPWGVDLQTMINLAILVDKYQLGNLLLFHANIWAKKLEKKTSLPNAITPDLISWLCISWAFELDDMFANSTRIAIKFGNGDIPNDRNLPIPDRILRKTPDAISEPG